MSVKGTKRKQAQTEPVKGTKRKRAKTQPATNVEPDRKILVAVDL